MEERGFEQYLEKAVSHISNKKKRKEIEEELAGHLEDKKELLMIKGFQEEDAKQKVLEEMGGAEELSRTLGILHSKVPKDEQGRLFVMLELGTGLSLISLNGY